MSSKHKKSGEDKDDVLSIDSGSMNEFSGFSSLFDSEYDDPPKASVRSAVREARKNTNKSKT